MATMEVLPNGMSAAEPVDFTPCSICGRTFNPEVLTRHERVCSKNQKLSNKRPVFDTSKKRIEGTDLQSFLASRPSINTKKPSTAEIKATEKRKNWKRKHEDFINSIRSAKEYAEAETTGKTMPPPRPSQPNPDYVQCPHCERRFEEFSAERHVPFCKEKHNRIERKANKAMDKLNKRIQYKPPKLKKKTSDQDATPPKKPPGYHLAPRKSNFSGTYNIDDENSPRSYGGRNGHMVQAQVPKSFSHRMSTSSHTSATPARDLPGSSSDPWMRGQETGEGGIAAPDDRQTKRRRSRLKTPQSVVAGFANGSLHHHQYRRGYGGGREGGGGGVGLARQIRGVCENDGGQMYNSSSSSFGGEGGDPLRLGPVKPKGKSKGLRVRADSPPPHEDNKFDFGGRGGSGGDGMRGGSGSSLGGGGGGGRKGVPLNQHGMTMSKFCYECGASFPVPQAKYCCECGTKRI